MDIRRIGLVSATVLSVFAAYASDKSFCAADGGWEVDANWSPSGVPAAGDVVKIPVGTVCRLGPGVATANVQTTVDAGGTLLLAGGTLATSDNSAVKKNLTVNGRLTLASGVLAVHDLTIGASGKAELAGGSVSVYNNMYNNAATCIFACELGRNQIELGNGGFRRYVESPLQGFCKGLFCGLKRS